MCLKMMDLTQNHSLYNLILLSNTHDLILQVKAFKPSLVSVKDESLVSELKEALADVEHKPEIIPGEQGMIEVSIYAL